VCILVPLPEEWLDSSLPLVRRDWTGGFCAAMQRFGARFQRDQRSCLRLHLCLMAVGGGVLLGGGTLDGQVPNNPPVGDTATFTIDGLDVTVPRTLSAAGGSSTITLDLDSMAGRPSPRLSEVLREMPLLQLRQNSRGEVQPTLRASGARQIAVVLDGVPLTLGWDHRTDLSGIPLSGATRVQLARALSSVLDGPNVLGGVITVDVGRPGNDSARGERAEFGILVDHVGGWGIDGSGGRTVQSSQGSWRFRGGLGGRSRPGLAVPAGHAPAPFEGESFLADGRGLRLNSDARQVDGFLSAGYRGNAGEWFSFTALGHATERGVPPETHVGLPRLWRYQSESRRIGALSAGTGRRRTPLGAGELEMNLGLEAARTDLEQFASGRFDSVTGREEGDGRVATARLRAVHDLGRLGSLGASFTVADVLHHKKVENHLPGTFQQRLWSLGSEVEIPFEAPFTALQATESRVSLGMALDRAGVLEAGGRQSPAPWSGIGGRIGVSTPLGQGGVLLHGALSRRTRFPALRELYSGALGRFLPNPDLGPETMEGSEFGFTANRHRTELQVVGFYQRLVDGIVRADTTNASGAPLFTRRNQEQVRSLGLEGLATAPVGPTVLSGDFTLQRTRGFTSEGRVVELEYQPAIAGTVRWDVPMMLDIRGSADVSYLSRQLCVNPEGNGLMGFRSDPHWNLSFQRNLVVARTGGGPGGVTMTGAVENVGNATILDQCGLPRPGRTFRIQMRLR